MTIGSGLSVPDSLGKSKPLRLVGGRVREVKLGSQHGRHAPETLIVVSERGGVVSRLVVDTFADLEEERLADDGVVGRVACVVPIIKHGTPEGSSFPPVVIAGRRRSWQDTGSLASFVSVVVEHRIVGERSSGCADLVCNMAPC